MSMKQLKVGHSKVTVNSWGDKLLIDSRYADNEETEALCLLCLEVLVKRGLDVTFRRKVEEVMGG